MVIDGDVERLDPGAGIAMGTVAGGADAGVEKAAKLFNIKMKELAGSGAFVTDDGRFGRLEGSQTIKAMTFEDAGKGSFGAEQDHEDLGVGTALAAEGEDLILEVLRSFAWLLVWDTRVILQARWEVGGGSAFEPFADGFIGDVEGGGGGAQ